MKHFSSSITVFHERIPPEGDGILVGYAHLIEKYALRVPLPEKCALVSSGHRRYETDEWMIYPLRYKPLDTLAGHLTFALKYEGLDLAILHALFNQIDSSALVDWINSQPVGRYSRCTWFLYEWLMEKKLDLPDTVTGNYVDVLDATLQYPGVSKPSKRHRVRNNLPGVPNFCPLIRCTEKLQKGLQVRLDLLVQKLIAQTQHELLERAAAFLVLKDSRASFSIEDEYPQHDRLARWGKVIGQAGYHALTQEELLRLQALVLEDDRFVQLGFRQEGGFIGTHDRVLKTPVPEHISARWDDLNKLIQGVLTMYHEQKKGPLNPLLLAATVAFGFVFIHPFIDGNGRIHRYLLQHVLAETGFIPQGIIFPLSAVILSRIHEYRQILQAYSKPRLSCIDWRPTPQGNLEVLNTTVDLYRYFDATKQAEFLYECMEQAVQKQFPEEIIYLKKYDQMKLFIKQHFIMPDQLISLVLSCLEQNEGILSKKMRQGKLAVLSEQECQVLQEEYKRIFTREHR